MSSNSLITMYKDKIVKFLIDNFLAMLGRKENKNNGKV